MLTKEEQKKLLTMIDDIERLLPAIDLLSKEEKDYLAKLLKDERYRNS